MRSLLIIIVLIGVLAFVVTGPRHRVVHISDFPEALVTVTSSPAAVSRPAVVAHKTSTKKSKRAASTDSGYSFCIVGTSDTPEAARKDAIDQASRYIASALELKKTVPDHARLEKLVVDEREGTEGFLGPSESKGLGEGKQIELTFELPTDYLQQLTQSERGFRMDERMGWLARGLAVIVAGLFAISGYIRLDEWSKGYFSGVLKAIALAAVIGTGIAVFWTR